MKINWVGGDLPKIGKSWMVRGLTESIFNKYQISPIVVDTSIGSKLSRIYNPKLLELYDPSLYFTECRLAADEIGDLARRCGNLIIKLSSMSQSRFLNWLEYTDMLESDVEHHFWFITNGDRDSVKYFKELHQAFKPSLVNSSKCRLSIVRNWYDLKWKDSQEIEGVNTCNLSGIITNPQEIQYIEDNRLILSEVASLTNCKAPLIFRSRLMRFLTECDRNFLPDKLNKPIQEKVKLEIPISTLFTHQEDEQIPI
jgi:hypothetical protein